MPKLKKRGRPLSSEWVDTGTAVIQLGLHRNHLAKLRMDGTFQQGKHWIDIRSKDASMANYRWHLKNCQAALEVPPEKR